MTRNICSQCGFKFEAKNPIECPYCGRRGTLEKEKSAGELLDDVNSLLNE